MNVRTGYRTTSAQMAGLIPELSESGPNCAIHERVPVWAAVKEHGASFRVYFPLAGWRRRQHAPVAEVVVEAERAATVWTYAADWAGAASGPAGCGHHSVPELIAETFLDRRLPAAVGGSSPRARLTDAN
eukprot:3932749-Rhodomonas_salina.1